MTTASRNTRRRWILVATAVLLVVMPVAFVVLFVAGAQPAVEADTRARELVTLGGNPGPVSRLARLRVVVADFGLASQSTLQSPRWLDRDAYVDAVHTLGREVAVTQADVVVLYDVLFDGYRASGVPTAERIAVEASLPWRVEANLWNRRFAMYPLTQPSMWAREVVGGMVVLSRFPILRHSVEVQPPRPDRAFWDARRGALQLVLQTGPEEETVLQVLDGTTREPPRAADDEGLTGLQVRRMDGMEAAVEDHRVATDRLEVLWGGTATAVLTQNTTRFHDNLRDPVVMVELSIPEQAEPTRAEDPNPTDM